jgi:ATP-binding cassette, subfamily B (MDR/TAP), member 1
VIGSIRTVVSLGRERMFLEQFIDELVPAKKASEKNTHLRGLVYGLARSIIFFAFAASMYYGGYLIINKGVSYEDVLKLVLFRILKENF